jgi:thymidylate synthase (FAD)
MPEPLARINLLDKGFVELLDVMGGDNTIVSAARISYLGETKEEESDKKLIKYMLKHHHTSPFEHVIFQWRIKCPLFVRSQWHRHRTWSYNEVSRRYTDENVEFYFPNKWRLQDTKNKQGSNADNKFDDTVYQRLTKDLSEACLAVYERLILAGIAKEQARMVLPQNMYTSFYGTVDLHNLLHFIYLRNTQEAQHEIRVYAEAMENIIKDYIPWTYDAWTQVKNEND